MNIIYYRHNKKHPAMAIPKQKISFCELTVVYKGKLDYKVNGTRYTLRDNQAIYIKSDSERERAESKTETDYVSFNFVDCDEELSTVTSVTPEIKMLTAYCDMRLETLGKEFYREGEKIVECIISRFKKEQEEKELPVISRIKTYVKVHLDEKITLADLCRETNYSPSRLSALFKKETNLSPIEYIILCRIEKAKELLIEGIMNEEDIGYKVGFSEENYFIRAFKKRTGITPYQFRKLFITTKQRTAVHTQ